MHIIKADHLEHLKHLDHLYHPDHSALLSTFRVLVYRRDISTFLNYLMMKTIYFLKPYYPA